MAEQTRASGAAMRERPDATTGRATNGNAP